MYVHTVTSIFGFDICFRQVQRADFYKRAGGATDRRSVGGRVDGLGARRRGDSVLLSGGGCGRTGHSDEEGAGGDDFVSRWRALRGMVGAARFELATS